MAPAPLNVSLVITAEASGVAAATGATRREVESVATSAHTAQSALDLMARSTDATAVASRRASEAARGQAAAQRDLVAVVNAAAGIRGGGGGEDYARRSADIQAYGAALDQLRVKFDPLFAVQQRYAAAIEEINRATRVGAIDASTSIQATLQETAAYKAQVSALQNLAAARKASAQEAVDRATITPDRAQDIAAYGAELDRLRVKYNPVYAASKAYERELGELSQALRVGAISAQEHGAALDALNARYAALRQQGGQLAGSTAMAEMRMRNLAFQFQDIGTMMASGQNPFLLLSQQLPQITMYGGRLTGVMGALRSTVASIFSPLGLITTGFVLAGSAAISYFSDAGGEADAAADALDQQASLIKRVADQWGLAVPELKAYADEQERLVNLSDLQTATATTIDARFAAARADIGELRTEIGELITDMFRAGESSTSVNAIRDAFNEADRAAQDLRDAQKDGKATTEDAERVNRALASLLANEFVVGSDDAADAIRRYRDALKEAADESARLAGNAAVAPLGDKELGVLGRVGPVYSDGGKFINEAELQDVRANATKSQYQIEQERLARRTRRPRRSDAERAAERYGDIVANAEAAVAAQRLEAEAYGMTEIAADRLRQQQELLNQARSADIALTPQQVEELKALGTTLADVTAETERQGEALAARKGMWGDVIGGLRQAASDGKIELQELGDIGIRVLDRLIDKMETDLVDALSNLGGFGGGGGGGASGGNWLSSIFGSLFGGLGGGPAFNTNATASAAWSGLRLDTGGYTGPGGRLEEAGTVHRDEFVFSSPAVRAIGVSRLDRLHRRATGRGYADGGWTGDGGLGTAPGGGAGAGKHSMHFEQTNYFSGAITPKEIEQAIKQGTDEAVAKAKAEFRTTYETNKRYGMID